MVGAVRANAARACARARCVHARGGARCSAGPRMVTPLTTPDKPAAAGPHASPPARSAPAVRLARSARVRGTRAGRTMRRARTGNAGLAHDTRRKRDPPGLREISEIPGGAGARTPARSCAQSRGAARAKCTPAGSCAQSRVAHACKVGARESIASCARERGAASAPPSRPHGTAEIATPVRKPGRGIPLAVGAGYPKILSVDIPIHQTFMLTMMAHAAFYLRTI